MKHSDVVINVIGKYHETKHLIPTRRSNGKLSNVNYGIEEVNVDIPARIARISKEAGVKSFIQVSALAADLNSKSVWNRTKAEGEIAVREKFPESVNSFFFKQLFMSGITNKNFKIKEYR